MTYESTFKTVSNRSVNMKFSNRTILASERQTATGVRTLVILLVSLALPLGACGNDDTDAEGRRLPSDKQVVADVTPAETDNVVDVRVTSGSVGESYLHDGDLVWYFDRGVVIKRKAEIKEAPNAVLVVGGLARYQLVGNRYEYRRFLTTYNEYEGISAPSESELTAYVENNLHKIFVSRDHNILDVSEVLIEPDAPWVWHAPTSFSVPFRIHYKERRNNTTIEERADIFDVRFYKKSITDPVHTLMATEKSRTVVGKRTLAANEIDQMRKLRTDFK